MRRGLLKRETEIINLIHDQKLDVLILVETDTTMISNDKDYMIPGFKTWIQIRKIHTYIHTFNKGRNF